MGYKIVSEHDDGLTLREIAASHGVDFSRGLGFYELTKKEKVSAGKMLVLWANGKVVSDDSAEVLRRCGLKPHADNNIQPKDIPAGHKLFVQSTSPNRKISEDAAALFVVDGDDEDVEVVGQNEVKVPIAEDEGEEEDEEIIPKDKKRKNASKSADVAHTTQGMKQVYKVITIHEDGATLKDIAVNIGLNFILAFYELKKKEKVSAGKKLFLIKGNEVISDNSADILTRCGLKPNADNNIEPKHIPAGHQLFVQSTSPNRKMPADAAAGYYVSIPEEDLLHPFYSIHTIQKRGFAAPAVKSKGSRASKRDEEDYEEDGDGDDSGDGDDFDGEPSKKRVKAEAGEWAVNFDGIVAQLLSTDDPDEFELEWDDLEAAFINPIGTLFSDCDRQVPAPVQATAVYHLTKLFQVKWDLDSIHFETGTAEWDNNRVIVKRASATGTLAEYELDPVKGYMIGPKHEKVRIAYNDAVPVFICSLGQRWGVAIGGAGDHPFIRCNEIQYDNSDGSSSQRPLPDLPPGADPVDRLNSLIAYNIKWFLMHCGDSQH